MDHGAVYDLLASRYAWLSLEKFERLTPANIYFLVNAAVKGRRNDLEIEAALHGAKLKAPQEVVETSLNEEQKARLDKLAMDQLKDFPAMRVNSPG